MESFLKIIKRQSGKVTIILYAIILELFTNLIFPLSLLVHALIEMNAESVRE